MGVVGSENLGTSVARTRRNDVRRCVPLVGRSPRQSGPACCRASTTCTAGTGRRQRASCLEHRRPVQRWQVERQPPHTVERFARERVSQAQRTRPMLDARSVSLARTQAQHRTESQRLPTPTAVGRVVMVRDQTAPGRLHGASPCGHHVDNSSVERTCRCLGGERSECEHLRLVVVGSDDLPHGRMTRKHRKTTADSGKTVSHGTSACRSGTTSTDNRRDTSGDAGTGRAW